MTAQAAPTTPTPTATASVTSPPAAAPASQPVPPQPVYYVVQPQQPGYQPMYHPAAHQPQPVYPYYPGYQQTSGGVSAGWIVAFVIAGLVVLGLLLTRAPIQWPFAFAAPYQGSNIGAPAGITLDPAQHVKGKNTCNGRLVWDASSPKCHTLPDGGRKCPFKCV